MNIIILYFTSKIIFIYKCIITIVYYIIHTSPINHLYKFNNIYKINDDGLNIILSENLNNL